MPLISASKELDSLTVSWSLGHQADHVWRHLMNPERLTEWLGRPVEVNCLAGGGIRIDHGDGYICDSTVKFMDETDYRMNVSWKFPDEPQTMVEIRIEPENDGTVRFTLRHAGLGGLVDSYEPGWITHLTYFEASLDGTPLPPGQFWQIHGTLRAMR